MVCARSAAEMPVETPSRASTLTVNAVPSEALFFSTIIGSRSRSMCSSVSVRQISPRACFAMKLIASGVTRSAASTRSPSFSRSSSSVRITIRPSRIAATAARTRDSAVPSSIVVTVPFRILRAALASARHPPAAWIWCLPLPGQRPRHVARDHVDLKVHPVAHAPLGQRRRPLREGHQHHLEALRRHRVDRQAHAVDGDAALLRDVPQHLPRRAKHHPLGALHPLAARDLAHPVDVPRHDVPAHAVAQRERPFEVHPRAHAARDPRVVRARVSALASAVKPPSITRVTVRHTPSTATLSPSSSLAKGHATSSHADAPRRSTRAEGPYRLDDPVNTV
jgi:hypothetical protein